ncbi:putative undecaprenyl-phosphate N-acetylglucosaminyl 1-phosphate transferase [mine drainage metagenome]|jgi:UDP-N-acetylmuramyl pentapeptide phosphotransferase/UDP-N-acetylglucosamine-1-phosphate transferase|uniref:Putative undecaprenyl-phosphate N-acetylglucosaminyl 1-phosphate transferase n=1 Tax=mine drainage metagenome TaxID=410659 RepID=A0A1J5R5X4_9ZZZZ
MIRESIALAALLSWLACVLLIVLGQRWGFGLDETVGELQKKHRRPTARSGGLAIVTGFAAGAVLAAAHGYSTPRFDLQLAVVAAPLLLTGVWEDLRRHLSPPLRAAAGVLSALLAVIVLGAGIDRIGVPGVDALLHAWPLLGVVLSVVGLAALPHAVNMIDGFHGLAGAVGVMILAAIGYVAFKVGDAQIMVLAGVGVGALLGFLFWNWPRGDIFLGDAGAYFIGFVAALLATLLVRRHAQVSPWFALAVLLYPSWELLFSVYRRRVLRGRPGMLADTLHLHHLVHRRLQRALHLQAQHEREANAHTAPYLWGLAAFSIGPAVLWWDRGAWLAASCLAFVVVYVWSYRVLLR